MVTDSLIILGVVLVLALWIWSWRGRSQRARWWVGDSLDERVVRGLVPAVIVLVLGVVGVQFTGGAEGESLWSYIAGFGLLVGVALIAGTLLFIPLPRWWAPGWFRELSDSERRTRTGGLSVFQARAELARESTVDSRSSAGVDEAEAVKAWGCSLVYDPDSKYRAHGLAGRGSVAGRLVLLADRLVFHATASEDVLRGEPTVVDVSLDDIDELRVVPARAGVDGVPRPGRLYRSVFPRLVVTTHHQSLLFEVTRARQTVRTIEEARAPVHE